MMTPAAFLATLLVLFAALVHATNGTGNPFDFFFPRISKEQITTLFSELTASSTLNWTSCFPTFSDVENGYHIDCARLMVPLDHNKPDDNRTMQLPIVRISPALPQRTVFWNPGGPGVNAAFELIEAFNYTVRRYVGNDTAVIAIAPRGTESVTPSIECYPDGESSLISRWRKPFIASGIWGVHVQADFLEPDFNDASLKETWAAGRAYGMDCVRNAGPLLEFAGTIHTVKDMELVRQQLGLEKLSFLGHSYGTILGATYARLYPDKVDRMVLDGVAEFSWYKHPSEAGETMSGPSAVLEMFFESCQKAGAERCALWDEECNTIRENFHSVIPILRENPAIVEVEWNQSTRSFPLSERSWKNVIEMALVEPWFRALLFPELANVAAHIIAGNTISPNTTECPDHIAKRPITMHPHHRSVFEAAASFRQVNETCEEEEEDEKYDLFKDPAILINCADHGGYDRQLTPDDIRSLVLGGPNRNDSIIVDTTLTILICASANFPAVHPFRDFSNVTTSGPGVLFVGNTADPKTPLYNAKKFHEAFTNSGLLTIDGIGHCSNAADPDFNCIREFIRPYFQTGKMPPEGTVCEGRKDLFARMRLD